MAKKFYVVWKGRETGVFDNWPQAKKLIDQFTGARYKSFPSKAEAEAAFAAGPSFTSGSASKPTSRKASAAKPGSTVPRKDYDISIYCDGGCNPNPGKAGSGAAVYRKGKLSSLWYGLFNPRGTNNTAELNALTQSLLLAKKAIADGHSVEIRCDSKYSIDCVTNWAFGWKAKGWKKKTGEIKNLDIIKNAHELFVSIQDDVDVSHIKAHIGIEGNELADRMTMVAVDRREPEWSRYPEPVDVKEILALRNG